MSSRELIVQISDPHIRVGPGDAEAAAALSHAVDAILALDPVPTAVLVTGDLANDGLPAEYARFRELTAPLTMPIHPIPGNHDDRDELRAAFSDHAWIGAGVREDYVHYAITVGSLRVVMCDTLDPGRLGGRLGRDRLDWIATQLDPADTRCVLLAMHHPPVMSAIDELDEIALDTGDRAALGDLVSRSPKVDRLICGHVHRAFTSSLGGVPVVACPSVHEQAELDLRPNGTLEIIDQNPAYAIHVHGAGRHIVSHVQPL